MHQTILDYLDRNNKLIRVVYFEEEISKTKFSYRLGVYEGQEERWVRTLDNPLSEGKRIILGEQLAEHNSIRTPLEDLEKSLEGILKGVMNGGSKT